jgi:hypothetical protein
MFKTILKNLNIIENSKFYISAGDVIYPIYNVSTIDMVYGDIDDICITLTGDESPNEDGTLKHRILTILKSGDSVKFVYKCDYADVFISFYEHQISHFKIYKSHKNSEMYNRFSNMVI